MTAFYVIFEGIDGCGKTTQAARLYERFKAAGQDARRWQEPTHVYVGKEIRRRLADGPPLEPWEALGLFVADRRASFNELSLNLERGSVVVQDRSYFSTAVYQGSKQGCPDWGFIVDYHEKWMPKPDLLILLDIPAEEANKRIEARGQRSTSFEEKEALARGSAVYKRILTNAIPEALVILDGRKSEAELEELIWNIAVRRLTDKNREQALKAEEAVGKRLPATG